MLRRCAPPKTRKGRVPRSNSLRTSQILEFPWTQARAISGSGKAEGFADGGGASHRQAALAAATRRTEISRTWDVANSFGRVFRGRAAGEADTLKRRWGVAPQAQGRVSSRHQPRRGPATRNDVTGISRQLWVCAEETVRVCDVTGYNGCGARVRRSCGCPLGTGIGRGASAMASDGHWKGAVP